MSKLLQALLSGVFYTFIIDFLLFLGIFIHYIQFLEIEIFYNILFADNQNITLFIILSIFSGYLIIYLENTKVTLTILGSLFLIVLLSLIPYIGYNAGKIILMKKNVTHKDAKYTFTGDIYYNGRKTITFYDYELKRIIILEKKDLIK
ncbi:MAG: hypothetical protein U9N02_03950 [Campylobacterota bacterium]|nr:hypothetical protein [Campylobacterota bacterium]